MYIYRRIVNDQPDSDTHINTHVYTHNRQPHQASSGGLSTRRDSGLSYPFRTCTTSPTVHWRQTAAGGMGAGDDKGGGEI